MLNSVRQHICFITQSSYIGYMFRLLISHLQAYFNRFSHKMLCTHWDPSVFTSIEYIKLDHSQLVTPNAPTYIRTEEQKSRDAVQTFISIDSVSNTR